MSWKNAVLSKNRIAVNNKTSLKEKKAVLEKFSKTAFFYKNVKLDDNKLEVVGERVNIK